MKNRVVVYLEHDNSTGFGENLFNNQKAIADAYCEYVYNNKRKKLPGLVVVDKRIGTNDEPDPGQSFMNEWLAQMNYLNIFSVEMQQVALIERERDSKFSDIHGFIERVWKKTLGKGAFELESLKQYSTYEEAAADEERILYFQVFKAVILHIRDFKADDGKYKCLYVSPAENW